MSQHQQSNNNSRMFKLGIAAVIGIFIVNIAGFIDTMTASTEGCGKSWPLCHGSIMPWNWDYHAWIEFGHRMLVFTASVLLVTLAILAWRKYGAVKRVRVFVSLAILGVVLESFLGAMAVFFNSPPALLAVHLGVALLSFGSLVALTVTIRQLDNPEATSNTYVKKQISRLTWFTFFFLYVAIYFGSYVASRDAGTAFKGFPFPTESYAYAGIDLFIDIVHRTFALGLLILLISLVVVTSRYRDQRPDLYKGSVIALVLVVLQAFSGGLLVYTHVADYATIIHVTIVTLLFGMVTILSTQVMPRPQLNGIKEKKKKENDQMKPSYSN